MLKKTLIISTICCLAAVLLTVKVGAVQYQARILGSLPGYWDSGARAINSSGQIIGNARDSSGNIRPVMWDSSGVMYDLGVYENHEGITFALNDSGWSVGYQNDGGYSGEATVWSPNGDMLWLGYGNARDINNAGIVVGTRYNDYGYEAYKWTESGGIQSLPHINPTANQAVSKALAINNDGTIVGVCTYKEVCSDIIRAVEWSADGTVSLLDGVDQDDVVDINDNGDVLDTHGTILCASGSMRSLAAPAGYVLGQTRSINDLGQVVGWSQDGVVFVWNANGNVYSINPLPGYTSNTAYYIDKNGVIAGAMYSQMGYQAVVWEPVPEPSSLVALLWGIVSIGAIGWGKKR